jgi:ABC-type lipoprotein release transport system permease subunit
MWFYLGLAARNVARHVRRTLLSMGSIVAGVAVIILGRAFIGGIEENIIHSEVEGLSGHVMLRPFDYPTIGLSLPVDDLVGYTPELTDWIEKNGGIWTPRLMFAPRAVHGSDAIRVRAIGYDIDRDPTVFPRDTWHCVTVEGQAKYDAARAECAAKHPPVAPATPDAPPVPTECDAIVIDQVDRCEGVVPTTADEGVMISQNVGHILDLKAGDQLILETRTASGAINALDVPIHAVFATGNNALDRFGVLVPMPLATDLVRPDGKVSHLIVKLHDRDDADAFAAALAEHQPPGSEIRTWRDETHDMLELQKIRRTALNVLVTILMIISALGIANTILMAAYERVREIGTLRAMGMTRNGVIGLFIAEGGLMGLVGGSIGALLGGTAAYRWSIDGISLGDISSAGNVAFSSMLYTQFSSWAVGVSILFGVIVAVGGSIWPAMVASSMQPADAVRAD